VRLGKTDLTLALQQEQASICRQELYRFGLTSEKASDAEHKKGCLRPAGRSLCMVAVTDVGIQLESSAFCSSEASGRGRTAHPANETSRPNGSSCKS
jgi:hypothetical protein